ncbi:MAG: biotin/lipoyl-containing protein [Candidatus Omnitrophota bacterium]
MLEIVLPDMGEDVDEATISFWHVEAGDHVEVGMDIVEVTTEKSAFTVQSPYSGVIAELRALEGENVQVGNILAMLQEEE